MSKDSVEAILMPRSIARCLQEEAEKQGLGFDEYVLELLSQSLDPGERALRVY